MDEQKTIKRFSEAYPGGTVFDADRVEMDSILEKEIIVEDIADMMGPYGDFIAILAMDGDAKIQFGTNGIAVVQKLKRAKTEEKLPLICKFVKKTGKDSKRTYYDVE